MSRFAALLDEFFYRPDEDISSVFDLGASMQGDVPAIKEEPPREFLAFSLAGETYAIPIDVVREIVKVPPLTEVPRGAANLLGVMNLRGEVMPVYDLKVRLHLADHVAKIALPDGDPGSLGKAARVIVLQPDQGPAGVLVDSVSEVLRMRASAIEAPPPGVASERDCVMGIGRRKDSLFILLDVFGALL